MDELPTLVVMHILGLRSNEPPAFQLLLDGLFEVFKISSIIASSTADSLQEVGVERSNRRTLWCDLAGPFGILTLPFCSSKPLLPFHRHKPCLLETMLLPRISSRQ